MVDKGSVLVDDRKTEKIEDAIAPTMRKDCRSFLRLTSYYQRFILCFTKITKTLSEKTSEKVKSVCIEEMQEAFEKFKENLVTPPLLAYSDCEKSFIIYTVVKKF